MTVSRIQPNYARDFDFRVFIFFWVGRKRQRMKEEGIMDIEEEKGEKVKERREI